MSKKITVIYGLLIFFILTSATRSCKEKDTDEDRIQWSEDTKLTWKDFKAKPDNSYPEYEAMTYVLIGIDYEEKEYSINFSIPSSFNRNLSWSKLKSKKQESLWLLEHEQLHFDIAELIARKIRKEYSEYKSYELTATYVDLQAIYDKYYKVELLSLNMTYDKETQHGKLRDKQKEWESKIEMELYKLRKYADTEVKVRRITVMGD